MLDGELMKQPFWLDWKIQGFYSYEIVTFAMKVPAMCAHTCLSEKMHAGKQSCMRNGTWHKNMLEYMV